MNDIRPNGPGRTPYDPFRAAIVLFMRTLQRDQSERPRLHVEPGAGHDWQVVVYIGDVPPKLAEAYARQASGAVSKQAPRRDGEGDPDAMSRVGRGPTVIAAVQEIVDDLAAKLRSRVSADVGALELATGEPVPIPPPVEPPQPHVEPSDQPAGRRTGLARRD